MAKQFLTSIQVIAQPTPPTPGSGFTLFAQSSSNSVSWIGANGFTQTLDATANTANRIYTMPNKSGTFALLDDISGGGGTATLLYNRRPPMHRGPLFSKTSATALSIAAGAVLNGIVYATATAVTMPGSFTNNTDYAIWQHPTTGALVADASFLTAPTGATSGSIVGGFHYIPSGRPTGLNNASPTASPEILEFSIWDLTWRPTCPDPRGMVCVEGTFWCDIFMVGATSYAGSTFAAVPSSRVNLTIADGSNPPLVPAAFGGNGTTAHANGTWFTFSQMAVSFGKRLPTYSEFSAAAFGVAELTQRATDAGTTQWERVSRVGIAQSTGVMWQWGAEMAHGQPPTAWQDSTESRGQIWGTNLRGALFGFAWGTGNSGFIGSRHINWIQNIWDSNNQIGARFFANHSVNG